MGLWTEWILFSWEYQVSNTESLLSAEEKWWHTRPFTATRYGPNAAQPKDFVMPGVGLVALLEPT